MSEDLQVMVDAYLTIRDERDGLKRRYEESDELLKKDMAEIEHAFLAKCNELGGVNSINTPSGTIIRKLNERYICGDWDGFRQFVLENQVVELLEKRIHQGNFKQFMEAHETEGLPPGVNVLREFGISVRRAS